jgi:predicted nucleotidyltransferase
MSWAADPLERRRGERAQMIAQARAHVERLSGLLPVAGAAVAGSVARGDFNLWSDVDVVLVSDHLPVPGPLRAEALAADAPRGLEVHGYTTSEFRRAVARGDRLAREALESGVLLVGDLQAAAGGAPGSGSRAP